MFGTTEFDGQSLYGEIPLQTDNSFAAKVPANVPFHIQLIDKFAMAVASGQKAGGETNVANESIWISGRAGEQRFCGGCHENRTDEHRHPAGPHRGRCCTGRSTWTCRAPSGSTRRPTP